MEDKIKKLEKELKYLTKDAIIEEVNKNKDRLVKEDVRVIANDIYLSRGLDITKLKRNVTSNLISDLGLVFNNFKNKDKKIKNSMIIDIVFDILLLILLKIPFDLVRDLGYEYFDILALNETYYILYNLGCLLLYTVVLICTTIVVIKYFNNKYIEK